MTTTPPETPLAPDTDPVVAPRTGVRTKYLAFMIAGLAVLAVSIGMIGWRLLDDDDAPDTGGVGGATTDYVVVGEPIIGADGSITYVIPNGTRDRIAAGEDLAVIPARITVKVGQTLILKNEDDDAHVAGPFFVGAGESSTYSFSVPKVIEGDCTIHPSGSFAVEVVA